MKSVKRLIVFLAIIFIISGSIFLAFAIKNNAFAQKDTVEKTYEIDGEFQNISAILEIEDLEFKLATDGKNKFVCNEKEKIYHEILVKDNCLSLKGIDERKWYEKIFIFDWNFNSKKSTLYLNKSTLNNLVLNLSIGSFKVDNEFTFENADLVLSTGDLKFNANITDNLNVKLSTGSTSINDLDCKNIEIKSSTGSIELKNVNCNSLKASASTGEIKLHNVITNDLIEINASTGDVLLDEVDSKTIYVKVSTGSIRGVILSPKRFEAKASTGNVNVPSSTTGGLCTLITSTGSINVSLKK